MSTGLRMRTRRLATPCWAGSPEEVAGGGGEERVGQVAVRRTGVAGKSRWAGRTPLVLAPLRHGSSHKKLLWCEPQLFFIPKRTVEKVRNVRWTKLRVGRRNHATLDTEKGALPTIPAIDANRPGAMMSFKQALPILPASLKLLGLRRIYLLMIFAVASPA